MSFKVHLVIVSCIILAVYFAWQILNANTPAPAATENSNSTYSITIAHASWGLNCQYNGTSRTPATESDGFANSGTSQTNPLREDNILAKIAELCNGKLKCTIPNTSEALGADPAPACLDKEINVEYRCFSYDRPWTIKSAAPAVDINCDKQPANAQ
jgi:hypothetical protein